MQFCCCCFKLMTYNNFHCHKHSRAHQRHEKNDDAIVKKTCILCNYQYKAKYEEHEHLEKEHPEEFATEIKCTGPCGKTYNPVYYQHHLPYCRDKVKEMKQIKVETNKKFVKAYYHKNKATVLKKLSEKNYYKADPIPAIRNLFE